MHSAILIIVTYLIHILHFFIIIYFTNPPEKKSRGVISAELGGPGNGSPSSYPMIRKLPVQKGTRTTGEVRWCTI
jgi:hypothetical protein